MRRIRILAAALLWSACITAADSGETAGGFFQGKVIVEWLDDPYVLKMRMTQDFAFRHSDGDTWVVPANAIVDGNSLPTLFVSFIGRPFDSSFRKTALVYDHAAKSKQRSWKDAQRMFHEAAIVEGVMPVEAKVMYLLLNAAGLRWAERGDRDCYGRCHRRDANLEWSPRVRDEDVLALVSWVRSEDPSLDGIEQQVDKVIIDDSPHMIGRIVAPGH